MTRPVPSAVRRRRLCLLAALLLGGLSPIDGHIRAQQPNSPTRQQPPVTFKVDVNYVEVPVVVVDRQGRFVPGLSQTDFEIREDGEPQIISTFGVVNLELEHTEASPTVQNAVASDVQSNARRFDGRLYVLLMDDLHVDLVNTPPTRQAARRFVETQVGPGDLAAVVCTGGCSGASQDFTADRHLLVAAIGRFTGRRLEDSTGFSSPLPGRESSGSDSVLERQNNARATLSTIRAIANSLAAVAGRRKALVLFSEGLGLPDTVGESERDVSDTISAAHRASVTVYSVDPAGLKLVGGRADVAAPIDGDPFATGVAGLQSDAQSQLEVVRRIAVDTGGFAAINRNNLEPALTRIGDDNSRYYLLGYHPATDKRDGKFHRLDVKVGVPDLDVRARAGYVASRANTNPSAKAVTREAEEQSTPLAVRQALDNPLPAPDLRLTACAAPFMVSAGGASATIVIQVDGHDIRLSELGGRADGGLVLTILATDAEGKVRNSVARTIRLSLRAEALRQVAANGLRIVETLALPHGRFRLRIAVQDVETQRVGSVHYDLDVPDFAALPFSMSGLVLTSTLAGIVPAAPSAHLDTFRPYLPGPPTTTRTFGNGEALALTAQVYDRNTAPHPIEIVASVRSEAGVEMSRREDQSTAAEMAGGRRAYRYATTIPLSTLAPGAYVLAVEARSPASPDRSARREVPFRIANAEKETGPRRQPGPNRSHAGAWRSQGIREAVPGFEIRAKAR